MIKNQEIKYYSTRGDKEALTSAQAIIKGIAPDGGLYVPNQIPKLGQNPASLINKTYQEIALLVLSKFFTDYTEEELAYCVDNAYDSKFEAPEVVPLKKAGDGEFLELYHGKTAAFKDMALSILPYLLTTALKKENENKTIAILTATSGDTGKAALEGFADVPGTEIIVFFPRDGVSKIQALQMTTQKGKNVHVYAINGNFDDAQTGVKNIFNNEDFAKELDGRGYKLSSANSINIGRLVPQVAYYVWAYTQLLKKGSLKEGQEFNVSVPTGNFGNILAAYYAKEMGLPIDKFICASNMNNVLTDFFNNKEYDSRRNFHVTSSPSMDILVSSNLERLLYHLAKGDNQSAGKSEAAADMVAKLMKDLGEKGSYKVEEPILSGLKDFYGGFADEEETKKTIAQMYKEENYLMDTHTAVGYKVFQDYKKATGDDKATVIASTASPYKFPESVVEALITGGAMVAPAGIDLDSIEGFEAMGLLYEKTGVNVPKELKTLEQNPVLHKEVSDKSKMMETVSKSLK